MFFQNDDECFELLVLGYTEEPEYYGGDIGRNALTCQFSHWINGKWVSTLLDELFQSNDLLKLQDGLRAVVNNECEQFFYTDKWKYVNIEMKSLPEKRFSLSLTVYNRGDGVRIGGKFILDTIEINELFEEVQELVALYPVV